MSLVKVGFPHEKLLHVWPVFRLTDDSARLSLSPFSGRMAYGCHFRRRFGCGTDAFQPYFSAVYTDIVKGRSLATKLLLIGLPVAHKLMFLEVE